MKLTTEAFEAEVRSTFEHVQWGEFTNSGEHHAVKGVLYQEGRMIGRFRVSFNGSNWWAGISVGDVADSSWLAAYGNTLADAKKRLMKEFKQFVYDAGDVERLTF